MGVDTRNKRASVLGLTLASLLVLPAPDTAIEQPDRQQIAYCYAGVSAMPPVLATPDAICVIGPSDVVLIPEADPIMGSIADDVTVTVGPVDVIVVPPADDEVQP